ncbi:MAG: histidine kinase [Pseudonocardiales bacterium]|nr:histidine kinase [Pseudonocardiales bacterium]
MTSAVVRLVRRALHPQHPLRTFVGVAVVALLGVAVGAVLVSRVVAQDESLRVAERTTTRLGDLVVGPLLADALRGDAARMEELDRAMAIRLSDGSLAEVTVWARDGTILYSTQAEVVGTVVPPGDEVLAAIDDGVVSSEVGTAEIPAAGVEDERLVEVYAPLAVAGQPPMAFEAYISTRQIDEQAASLAARLVLLSVVPLVLLQLVQIPIAIQLSRRVRRHDRERAELLERALSASERERRAIAGDLHDGVVQELAGTAYALAALSRQVPERERPVAEAAAGAVSSSVETLRRLMVDLYPPDLSDAGLAAALDDLARPLRDAGTDVEIAVGALPGLSPRTAATIYRVAREALANTAKHARARRVLVEVGPAVGEPDSIVLRISDDGVGPDSTRPREDGHLGLQMMRDRVVDAAGRFRFVPVPGGPGTLVEAVVPNRRD